MAPKKRTYSNVSESSDDDTTNVPSTAAPGPALAAPATPSAAPQNGSAAPRLALTLPTTTPTRPVQLPPLTKSAKKRMGMTSFGSESGGPTPRGSSYGYEHRLPTDAYPDFLNPGQREEVERQREGESATPTSMSTNAARQPGTSSPGLSYDEASTPTRTQQAARAPRLPVLQAPSSQQDSNFSQGQPSAIRYYGNHPLPRPGAGHQFAAPQPNPLPRSGLYGHESALQPAQASSPPPWRGSSYASSNFYGGSGAPTQPPSRAAGLAALSNIPGNPAYNPPAVPSIWGSEHWAGNAATGARNDPFTSAHTESSNWPEVVGPLQHAGDPGSQQHLPPSQAPPAWQRGSSATSMLDPRLPTDRGISYDRAAMTRPGNVPQHLFRPSDQHGGFEPPYAPTSRTSGSAHDDQPSTRTNLTPFDGQEYDWRVSPPPAWNAFVAATGADRSAQDTAPGQEDHGANRESHQAQDDNVDVQSEQSVPGRARQTQAANPGDSATGAQNLMESGMGSSSHAQEASTG
ncbi:hypothetical protein CBER1_03693 [Cercospora berteroae]|uniref:Uncharacterized protein n=1 Tax=Cercospora berteroae TaxID=357750 RepID=A0A2S6C7C2_9PEZI|nr:hypothetical protein CBER1_03693 [Cercospora berteroae]